MKGWVEEAVFDSKRSGTTVASIQLRAFVDEIPALDLRFDDS